MPIAREQRGAADLIQAEQPGGPPFQDYEDSILPSGYHAGTPQEALDCACGFYLNDHTAWMQPPTN